MIALTPGIVGGAMLTVFFLGFVLKLMRMKG